MVKLFCALVGAAGSAFSVRIDESEQVDDLKDAIWAKAITEEQKRGNVANMLQLYLANLRLKEGMVVTATKDDTWLNKESAVAVTLDEERHAVLEDENGVPQHFVMMDPSWDIVDYFGENFERKRGEIHVLVVVPEGAERDITAATTQLTTEQVEMSMNKVLEERDQKRSVYSISTCPRSKELLLKQQLGLEYATVPVNEVVDESIHGYQWSALTEKHPDQRKAYMEYVEEHLRDALISRRKQKDFLKDVAGKRNLLDCDDQSRLPFKVKGTADIMIIDEVANRMDDVFAGLRFVIEVKKDRPSYDERWQLLLELVVADLKSEGRCAPVGLLTNLNDYWYFLWFTPDNKIARMVLTCPANGFKTMKEVLKERSGPTRDGHFQMRVAFLDSPLPLKRQKLLRGATGRDDAAAEMLERYELMSDELSPEFLQRQRVEYAFNLIRQMPIHSAMYT